MNGDNRYPNQPGGRFVTPDTLGQIISPYDMDSRLLNDLQQRGIRPIKVFRIDLSVAGSLQIKDSGFHFVQYGFMQQTPGTDGNKPVNTTSLVTVQINTDHDAGFDKFPAKHARGYSSPFYGLFVEWQAQTSAGQPIFCDFILFKSSERPWIDGESAT